MATQEWNMTEQEFNEHLESERRRKVQEWNAAGSPGFPPAIGRNTAKERILLAERAGYVLPRDAVKVMAMSLYDLVVAANKK